ncbi:MAG: plasmid mobilization protein [Mobilitalea sp.]
MEKQNQVIKIYLSETEKNKIINLANQQQLSASEYAKKILLKGPIIFNIEFNDLLDFSWKIYETNCKIQELLVILNQSNMIDSVYAANIIKALLAETNNNCKDALKINYNERKEIYQKLENQIKKIIP